MSASQPFEFPMPAHRQQTSHWGQSYRQCIDPANFDAYVSLTFC